MQVEIFSDVVCPWCYIGKRRMEAALLRFAHAAEVTVIYRSFQLDPSAATKLTGTAAQHLAEKYGVPLAEAEAMNHRVSSVAAAAGLRFRLEMARPANTFDAHRLLHLAADHGLQTEMVERLMQAYFVRGESVGDAESLATMAGEVGIDPQSARNVLAGADYADAVAADLGLARSFGISAVPFFVIDRAYGVPGAQESDVLLGALDTAWSTAERLPGTMDPGPAGNPNRAADTAVDETIPPTAAPACAEDACPA